MRGGEVEAVVEREVDGVDGLGVHAPLVAVDGFAEATELVVIFEETVAPEVSEEIVGLDLEGRVAAPGVGIADSDFEGGEFGEGFFFGGWRHPGEVLEADAEGGDEVADERLGRGFGFRGEEALRVDLADGVAKDCGDEDVATDVAWTLLCGSGEDLADEGEALLRECVGGCRRRRPR